MESIGGLIVVFIVWWLINAFMRTAKVTAKSVFGKGTFAENMELEFQGMKEFEVRFQDTRLNADGTGPLIKEIEGKGMFPLGTARRIGFITSVFDATSGEWEPVLSAIEAFQEPTNIVYQHLVEVGPVSPSQGFMSWVRLGIVFPEILQTPHSGRRKMVAFLRMVDMDYLPKIVHGFHQENDPGLLWGQTLEFEYKFAEKGYLEAEEHRDEARSLAIKVGIAVAMADGSLDKSEGNTIRDWTLRMIEPYPQDKQIELKKIYSDSMRRAYSDANKGNLNLSVLTERLKEIGEKKLKYDTIELCFDVMAADGVADAAEMKIIRNIADALELDLDEIENLRDQKIIGLDTSVASHASVEDMLGIDKGWDVARIKKHLRTEFQKWNNRLNTLPEGDERQNAQRMLDVISEARKKYA